MGVPTILRYVLTTTKAQTMHWVGHSQGGGMLVFALAKDPTLKDLLGTSVLLAPGVHMANLKVPLLKYMSKFYIDQLWHSFGFDIPQVETHKFYFPGPGFSKIMHFFTAETPLCRISVALCNDIGKLMGISVGDPDNLDWRTMANAYSYDPGGSSFHLLMYWAQRIRKDTLHEFDWGRENPQHYNGSSSPPMYDLSKIEGTKLALFDGGRDLFITPKDIATLISEVPSQNWASHVTIDNYAHFDFVWGKDAHTRLYPEVVRILSNSSSTVRATMMI